MFIFDVETLGVESNAVILSAALIHFDPEKRPTYQDLIDDACFVKFKAKEQGHNGRTISKSTLEWWKTQHEYVKKHFMLTWLSFQMPINKLCGHVAPSINL
jgi:hypothetical protein